MTEVHGNGGSAALKVTIPKKRTMDTFYLHIGDGPDPVTLMKTDGDPIALTVVSALIQLSINVHRGVDIIITSEGLAQSALKERVSVLKKAVYEGSNNAHHGTVTAQNLYDLVYPDTIVPPILKTLQDSERKKTQTSTAWQHRVFRLWSPGGENVFTRTRGFLDRIFVSIQLAYMSGDATSGIRQVMGYIRWITENTIPAETIYNALELRGSDPLCNSALFRSPLQDKSAIVTEILRLQQLPMTQRNGLALTLYAWESMYMYIDTDKSDPCMAAVRVAGPIGLDGHNYARGALVASSICVLDSSMKNVARAMAQCIPIDYPPVPAPPILVHTRRIAAVFIADALDARIKPVTDRAYQDADEKPWHALALLRSLGLSPVDIALTCGRAPVCSERVTNIDISQLRLIDQNFATRFEEAHQLAVSFGFVPTFVQEVAHKLMTTKLRASRVWFAIPPDSPPILTQALLLTSIFEQLNVVDSGRPADAMDVSPQDAYRINLLIKGGVSQWLPSGSWPGVFPRMVANTEKPKLESFVQGMSTRPQDIPENVFQTPTHANEQVAQAVSVVQGCIQSATLYLQNGAQGNASSSDLVSMLRDATYALFEASHRKVIAAFMSGTATNEQKVYIQEFQLVYPTPMQAVLGQQQGNISITMTNNDQDMLARRVLQNTAADLFGQLGNSSSSVPV
jgi:hypothetical protein